MKLSADQIARYTQAPILNAKSFAEPLNVAMERFAINTPKTAAAFLATVAIESARLTRTEEDLYYRTAERLVSIYPRAFKSVRDAQPYVRNPLALSKLLYDGYHGRGLIQLTWRKNYQRAGDALGHDYVRSPELVKTQQHAALTAAWYWSDAGCNEAAEAGDMDEVTRLVNGPRRLHLEERVAIYEANLGYMENAA